MKRLIWLMVAVIAAVGVKPAAQSGSARTLLEAAKKTEVIDGDVKGAIERYKKVVGGAAGDRALAAEALVRMADCFRKLGDAQAQTIYEQVVREYGDQGEPVTEARLHLAALDRAATSSRQSLRPIWTNPQGGSRGPDALSPDGRFLGFTEAETGDLAIRDLSTGTHRRLTNTGGWAVAYTDASSISPDGQRIAYDMYLDTHNALELRVASTATGESTPPTVALRTTQNDGAYEIEWLPDGKQLIVVRATLDRSSQIGLVSIQDQTFRSIKSLEWRKPNRLAVSPDGRFVAYDVPAIEAGSPRDIFVLATDGSREIVAVKNPANDAFPVWSPDGSKLLFLSDRSGSNSLWAVPMVDGRPAGAPALLKGDVGLIRLLGISRTGTLFYFDRPVRPINLYAADIEGAQIATPPVPATERIINRNFGSTWSRDGEYLAYYSFRDSAFDLEAGVLVIRSTKIGTERTVALPTRVTGRFLAGPKWFPGNGAVLIEAADAEGPGFTFYRVAVDTGNTEVVGRVPRFAPAYELAADGRSLFYTLNTGDASKLMRLDFGTRRETELRSKRFEGFSTAWEPVALALSPDGTQLGMTIIGGAIEIMPIDGGASRTVFSPPQRELGTGALRNGLAWTPDQQFLLAVRGDGTFWRVPAVGGSPEKLNLSIRGIKSPTVHPDGKRLVFNATGDAKPTGVWALDNVVPSTSAQK